MGHCLWSDWFAARSIRRILNSKFTVKCIHYVIGVFPQSIKHTFYISTFFLFILYSRRCLSLHSRPPGSTFFTYILYNLLSFTPLSSVSEISKLLCCCSVLDFIHVLRQVFFFFFILEVFPHSNRRAKAEGVIHCRDCQAEWGNAIVIWDYINTIDLIWF